MNERRRFKINEPGNEEWIFKHKYPINYSLVMLHALFNYIKLKEKEQEMEIESKIDEVIKDLKNCFDSEKKPFCENGFLALYPVRFKEGENGRGFILVDESNGCFPLVIYCADCKDDHLNRILAFKNSLHDLIQKKSEILPLLISSKEWNEPLQEQICSFLPLS